MALGGPPPSSLHAFSVIAAILRVYTNVVTESDEWQLFGAKKLEVVDYFESGTIYKEGAPFLRGSTPEVGGAGRSVVTGIAEVRCVNVSREASSFPLLVYCC